MRIETDLIDLIDLIVDLSLEDVAAGRVYTQEQAKQLRSRLADRL